MPELVPNRLLLRFEIPVRYRRTPKLDGSLSDWSDEYLLPDLGRLEGREAFGKVWLAWNESGLFVACRVEGRKSPFQCDPNHFWKGDNFRLMTDMRDTRDIKRASRHCQQFWFLPAGGGRDGRQPLAGAAPVIRATEDAPLPDRGEILVAGMRRGGLYAIEGHIPAHALAGFDPSEHHRIGLTYMLEDQDLGQQYLTVGDEFKWYVDPSTWATGVLVRD